MWTRRLIAAFVTFAFASLLCAPAFAAVWAVVGPASGGCCCAPEKAPQPLSVSAPDCECPACVCSVDQAPQPLPFDAAPSVAAPLALALNGAVTPPVADAAVVSSDDGAHVHVPRGPPPGALPPLYILYDTLLI